MLLDSILLLGVRRQHTLVFLNTPPCYSYCNITTSSSGWDIILDELLPRGVVHILWPSLLFLSSHWEYHFYR